LISTTLFGFKKRNVGIFNKSGDVVDDDYSALVEDADISLFEAKERGRNQAKG